MSNELPRWIEVHPECEPITEEDRHIAVYECSDEAVGCSVEEWYPELEYGYYIVDVEVREVLDHTTDEAIARAYALGYAKGKGTPDVIPLFINNHEPQLQGLGSRE